MEVDEYYRDDIEVIRVGKKRERDREKNTRTMIGFVFVSWITRHERWLFLFSFRSIVNFLLRERVLLGRVIRNSFWKKLVFIMLKTGYKIRVRVGIGLSG